MNSNPNTASTATSPNSASADAISRRAYEIWENNGKPDGCDLEHWLQAEKEVGGGNGQSANGQSTNGQSNANAPAATPNRNTDTRPLQGTRGAPAPAKDTKRAPSPFGERAPSGGQTAGAKRR
ncbi:MAG TPA: DUF2934 domain-containing protein [Opitutaceae bacterium]|nr:DUF2934 domain-containing protein [Opitutaceae bacterium]